MAQFLIGFWCGCVAATLVLCLLFANKLRQSKDNSQLTGECGDRQEGAGTDAKGMISGPHVLLVDDSRLSRTVIREILLKRELEVYEAENGAESLKLAKKQEFDLIFIDQHMPGLDGDETLQRLWKDGGVSRKVPVVAVSSTIRKEHEEEYRAKGYAACLGKPIQENRLDEILARVLPHKEEVVAPEGFFYRKGLANFDGNESAYRETLVLFAELWAERKEQLRQFSEEENMPEYAILIHAIKGDARTLGAEHFGEMAYAQELQAKAGDVEAVKSGFEQVIEEGDKTAEYFVRTFS